MRPIVIIKETNKDGKFELTEEELKELIEQAYEQGFEDWKEQSGKITSVTLNGQDCRDLPQSQYDIFKNVTHDMYGNPIHYRVGWTTSDPKDNRVTLNGSDVSTGVQGEGKMREIKFRGKRISNGEWEYGGIVKAFHPNFACSGADWMMQVPNCYAICANGNDYFVEQKTIGQYTGLKDRNGVQIYEGDIVAINKELLGCYVVKYDENNARFGMYINGYEQAGFNKVTMKAYEVIGNIYDNPELLEERK